MKTILAVALMTSFLGVSIAPTASQAAALAAAVGGGAPGGGAPGGGAPGGQVGAPGGQTSKGYEGQATMNQCLPSHRKIKTGKLVFDRCWTASR